MSREVSPIKQKVLLILFSGLAFGFSYTPREQFKIIKGFQKEWKKISQEKLKMEIQKLYRSKLVKLKKNPDGSFTMILTDKGKLKALKFHFAMKIQKSRWGGKWWFVIFDIPEKIKKLRDALRWKLKELGFYELQKSVFIFPYECKDEIEFIIEFFNLRKFVRYGVLESIDNELHLKKIFKLI